MPPFVGVAVFETTADIAAQAASERRASFHFLKLARADAWDRIAVNESIDELHVDMVAPQFVGDHAGIAAAISIALHDKRTAEPARGSLQARLRYSGRRTRAPLDFLTLNAASENVSHPKSRRGHGCARLSAR